MAGNKQGGLKARDKNLANNPNFYKEIGAIGGANGTTGGFAYLMYQPCNCGGRHANRSACAGAIGGRISKRQPKRRVLA